jgi:hypothetical protein
VLEAEQAGKMNASLRWVWVWGREGELGEKGERCWWGRVVGQGGEPGEKGERRC